MHVYLSFVKEKGASRIVMFGKLDWLTISTEFVYRWVPLTSGLVLDWS